MESLDSTTNHARLSLSLLEAIDYANNETNTVVWNALLEDSIAVK